jgi:hypothetical protein
MALLEEIQGLLKKTRRNSRTAYMPYRVILCSVLLIVFFRKRELVAVQSFYLFIQLKIDLFKYVYFVISFVTQPWNCVYTAVF